MRYVAFLRGVNVGGKHVVRMERLRELCSAMGLENVMTYIQSGNLFFDSPLPREKLRSLIEGSLEAEFGFDVPTVLLTTGELRAELEASPFREMERTGDSRQFLYFLASPYLGNAEIPFTSPKGDYQVLAVTPRAAHVLIQARNGRLGDPTAFFKGVKATGRFYHTSWKILEAALT